jgi:hypothetical protein
MRSCDNEQRDPHSHIQAGPQARVTSRVSVTVCPHCLGVTWWLDEAVTDPWDAVAAVFGEATVVDRLPAVAAPGYEVLICRQPPRAGMGWLPIYTWLEAAPGLFMAREGRHLLITSPHLDLSIVFRSGAPVRRTAPTPA